MRGINSEQSQCAVLIPSVSVELNTAYVNIIVDNSFTDRGSYVQMKYLLENVFAKCMFLENISTRNLKWRELATNRLNRCCFYNRYPLF